ncbi:HD domain-containing protein [Alphaproteobacteria bacterium HT1-32]|nr:HD domain-containing protein [Alphaproteobacteria bacterium HT1-32]
MIRRSKRIAVHLSVIFVSLVVAVGVTLGVVQYFENREQQARLAEKAFAAANKAITVKVSDIFRPAELAVELVSRNPVMTAMTLQDRLGYRRRLARYLDLNPTLASVFIGYPDGDFMLVRRMATDADRERFKASADTQYVIQAIEREEGGFEEGVFIFYDARYREISRRVVEGYTTYDPRKRPWFQQAYRSGKQIKTAPYIFFTTKDVGTTLARGNRGEAVTGVDITLQSLSDWLASLLPVPGTDIALIDDKNRLIAHADPTRLAMVDKQDPSRLILADIDSPENKVLKQVLNSEQGKTDDIFAFKVEGEAYRGLVVPVTVEGSEDYRLLMAVSDKDLYAEVNRAAFRAAGYIAVILLISIAITVMVAGYIAKPLATLARDVQSIRRFDFSASEPDETHIIEIDELSVAIDSMKETIRKFLDISTAIAAEEDFDKLLERLLDEIIATTKTEAGILYLTSDNGKYLVPHAIRRDERRPLDAMVPEVSLVGPDNLMIRAIVDEFALGAVATPEEIKNLGIAGAIGEMEEAPRNLLGAPLFNRSHELVGVILLMETDEIMDLALVRFTEALSGSAAISVEARQLIAAQKQLFESFLQLIAGAIDAKSPYTGGHCERVPELTKMLAAAADRSTSGPYADFHLSSDDWEAIHVASWLHDCGKVTTPEFVVDKATKLETIFDRIHEVRMRVEVMKREAEISYLRDVLENGASDERRTAFEAELAQLDDDFAFIADCNIGGEFMSDDKIARIHELAGKTWTRTLDDRLGVAQEELLRMEREEARALPVVEPLLADRAHHRFERPDSQKLSPDNPWGFKLEVPELLYDRGEIHNLVIRRGTLTEEDRYKINEHIVQTIKMLDELPFPRHLRNVSEIAGGHHEKMDGTGYPKQLTAEEMSPVARMMAIADIFEALTATDRPYKKGKTLSEAIRIMGFMVGDKHIDPELFRLFIESGVYLDYARKFMNPEMIDDIDLEKVLAF